MIRDARWTDSDAMAVLFSQCQIRAEGVCLVAESDTGLVTGLLLYVGLQRRLSIEAIGVLADSRRLGYGTALVDELKRRCVVHGLKAIDVVIPSQWRLLQFFRACGFRAVKSERGRLHYRWTPPGKPFHSTALREAAS